MIASSSTTSLKEIQELAARLKLCKDLAQGTAVHKKIRASNYRSNKYLANLLIEMYGKCGQVKLARDIFEGINQPNLFSWNILLAAFARNGALEDSRLLFDTMPARDVVSWTAMVTAYAQNGHLENARQLFDCMPERNVVSWNIMLEAYAHKGQVRNALGVFRGMPDHDMVSRTSIMAAFAQNGYLKEARQVFEEMPVRDVVAWTVLLQAHVDAGKMDAAKKMFDAMPTRNFVSWNVMLPRCYGGLELFRLMNLEGEVPDENSFVGVFTACSHLGLVDESLQQFCGMLYDHGKMPTSEQLSCMIDLLGRVGRLDEAAKLVQQAEDQRLDNPTPWITMVSAAKMHGDLESGAWAAKQMVHLDPDCSASYALASNLVL